MGITNRDAQVSKLQEDEAKARAAAEAGIDAALDQGEIDDLGTIYAGSDDEFSGNVQIDETNTSNEFLTPLIQKDSMYTFYLKPYNEDKAAFRNQGVFNDPMSVDVVVPQQSALCSDSSTTFAVELIFLSSQTQNKGVSQVRLIDPCNLVESTTDKINFGDVIATTGFAAKPQIVLLRVIAPSNNFNGTKLLITNENSSYRAWPAQGRTITSTASVGSVDGENVTKKVQLFQSYPQIPAEFYITSE